MTELDWMHFTAPQTGRKRAELVCVVCHSKKIKCDLQSRTNQGHSKCSNCDGQSRDCRVRTAKRDKRQKTTAPAPVPGSFCVAITPVATDDSIADDESDYLKIPQILSLLRRLFVIFATATLLIREMKHLSLQT